MPLTPAIFRADFTEFASAKDYPDTIITWYLNLAANLLNPDRWDDAVPDGFARSIRDQGTELLVAHNLALRKRSKDAARAGAAPGLAKGPISSQTVGRVSTSYDTQRASEEDNASHWNLTEYGIEFIHLAKLLGAGPMQENIGVSPPFTTGAWPGPWPWPLPGGVGFSS